jgi:hypothetical protein
VKNLNKIRKSIFQMQYTKAAMVFFEVYSAYLEIGITDAN